MTDTIIVVRIELRDIWPKIWRRVEVPLSFSLMSLHNVIRITFGWGYTHPFGFRAKGEGYGARTASRIRLRKLVSRKIKRFSYVYDFGDNWEHDIFLRSIKPGKADVDYPVLVAGARKGPPEDIGGIWGFERFLEAVHDPSGAARKQIMEGYDYPHSFFDDYDPDEFDKGRINRQLAPLRR